MNSPKAADVVRPQPKTHFTRAPQTCDGGNLEIFKASVLQNVASGISPVGHQQRVPLAARHVADGERDIDQRRGALTGAAPPEPELPVLVPAPPVGPPACAQSDGVPRAAGNLAHMLLVELSPFNKSRLPVYVAYTFSRVPELAVAVPPPAVDGPAVRAGRGVPQTCRGVDNTQPPEAADQRRLRDRRPGGGAALPVLVGAPAQQPAARPAVTATEWRAPAATCATACPVAPGVALPEGRPAGAPGPATRDGPKDLDKPPAPTCPSMLPPQAQTRPSTDKARQWQSPAATSLTLTDCRPQVGRSAIVHPLNRKVVGSFSSRRLPEIV
eukprot:CAMPEP_0177611978 /NCGR_PEP_ID=MMETSP0419_2-20121207/20895_1 /TAXON_ID=582737 /ORGANISM="Tetraselmis sp., Strain GSL018" /LENGTH=326 /DNA_ID=CAMNT_0019107975 /DNA_START=592 /DNA_END=1573 /DNA_ORIENTATION=-